MPAAKGPSRCTGSCHCGAVSFAVPRDLGPVRYCYCVTCRKLSGAAFSVVARVAADAFQLLEGKDSLSAYESSPGKYRHYCSRCHSPVYVRLASRPEEVRVRLGLLDDEPRTRIEAHMWVDEKPAWHRIEDDLPQYPREYTGV